MVHRPRHLLRLQRLLAERPVVALLGARQVGKTTLARELISSRDGRATLFDLENADDLAQLDEPLLALEPLRGLVVIDEVQRREDLFTTLRVLADRPRTPARFLVLGSASPALLRQGAETLAGRIGFCDLPGFDLEEVGAAHLERLWIRGGFPRSYLAKSHRASADWRRDFIRTFLERDVPQLGAALPPRELERFWAMLAHYHGQIWNASELGRSFGISHTTVQKYVDLLAGAFVVTELRPWAQNLGKRAVRSPKIYVTDSGLLHALLGVTLPAELRRHPKLGASFEGFVVQQLMGRLRARREECFFWATHAGAELDLLVVRGQRRLGFEVKHTAAPKVTRSMRAAIESLSLERLTVVHAGRRSFALAADVRAVAVADLLDEVRPL